MTNKIVQYNELTPAQAEQVQRDFKRVRENDPWLFEYELDATTGKVVDVYRVVKYEFIPQGAKS